MVHTRFQTNQQTLLVG